LTDICWIDNKKSHFLITARRNARIVSAVLATAIPSVRQSVRPSVCPSVTRRYCVKTTARLLQLNFFDISHGCRAMRRSVCNARASNAGRSLCVRISRERSYPLPIYWYHSEGNWLRYNFAADSFYIMKLCSRLLVLYCRNCPKDDKFSYLIPILRKLGAA